MLADRLRMSVGTSVDDTSGSPGSDTLIAGDMQAGFFGEVDYSAMGLSNHGYLVDRVGIPSGGMKQNVKEPYLKFAYEGKILFKPRKSVYSNVSWEQISRANAVYGDKIMVFNGITYKVRLMRGARNDPSRNSSRYAHGSEWNKLMLPIHENSINGWSSSYVEDNIPVWGHSFGTGLNGMYTDSDLGFDSSYGNQHWVQETSSANSNGRFYRGNDTGPERFAYNTVKSNKSYDYGWAPVLEVVQ